jgi:hypothetical protein
MSDTALFCKAAASLGDLPLGCQVLILSEDFAAYSRAVQVCRRILDQSDVDRDFDFRCWNFVELASPECFHAASKYAGMADIVMLSTHTTILPIFVNEWLDTLHTVRFRTDGALVLILNKPASQPHVDALSARLENLALRLVMDFVPLLPASSDSAWRSQPSENWAMISGQVDLADSENPEHWGLNE